VTDDLDAGLTPDSGERYERRARIATGGMGEVWRARDTVLGREVAVKILKREYADDHTFRARFAAEARHAAGLHHPGIATVFDYGLLPEGTPYLVMELVDGKPLSELLANKQPLDAEPARMLALQTAEALAFAHAAGVVHRDVKPANLLVTPGGRIKITDFGIARAIGSVAFTQTGQIVGTPQYLSPEQARGDTATPASDVYALGVVLFECLSGRRPFSGDTPIATALAQIQQEVPPLPDTVPAALAAVVARALAKDPAERYADGTAVAAALRAAGDGPATVPDPDPDPVPVPVPVADPTQVLTANAGPADAAVTDTGTSPSAASTKRRSRAPLYAVGLLALALLAALLVAHPWTDDSPGSAGSSPSTAAADDTVRVRRAAYVGEPVDDVVAALRAKDLKPEVETQDNPGDQERGTVADLDPTGLVAKGSTINLQVWGDSPPAEQPRDEPKPSGQGGDVSPSPDNQNGGGNEGEGGGVEETEKPPKPEKSDKAGPGNGTPSDEASPGNGRVGNGDRAG
jgi:eukaryotic-like serine/threonine-protein kinase